MKDQLVLVVDQTTARIFASKGRQPQLTLLKELSNPEGRLKEGDLLADHGADRVMRGVNGYEPPTTAKKAVGIKFIKEVVTELGQISNSRSHDLTVMAAPRVLGWIRPEIKNLSHINVVREVRKDLSEFKAEEIASQML